MRKHEILQRIEDVGVVAGLAETARRLKKLP